MPQRRRHDTSTAIAIASDHKFPAAPPRMVWDERIAALNLNEEPMDEQELRRIMVERHALIHRAMLILTPRELAVIHRHYGFYTGEPMDLRMCAEDLNVTYNAVQKRHNVAMRKLARFLKVPYRKRPGKWWSGSEGYGW